MSLGRHDGGGPSARGAVSLPDGTPELVVPPAFVYAPSWGTIPGGVEKLFERGERIAAPEATANV